MITDKFKTKTHLLLCLVLVFLSFTGCFHKPSLSLDMGKIKHLEIDGKKIDYSVIVKNEGTVHVTAYQIIIFSEGNEPIKLEGSYKSVTSKGQVFGRNGSFAVATGSIGACIIPVSDNGEVSLALGIGSEAYGKNIVGNLNSDGSLIHPSEEMISTFSSSDLLHLVFLDEGTI